MEKDIKEQSEKIMNSLDQTLINATDKVAPVIVNAVDKIEDKPKATNDSINKDKNSSQK